MQTSQKIEVFHVKSKYFQLEELEDKESCSTEIFLSDDGSVTMMETNGPPPISAVGRWLQGENDEFKMTFVRTFGSGSSSRDMGEFSYEVERTFTGEVTSRNPIQIHGSVHCPVSSWIKFNNEFGLYLV